MKTKFLYKYRTRILIVRQRIKMNNDLENFKKWFSDILETIYPNQNAGFAILMLSFPLLERYLREKSGVREGRLNDAFYTSLISIFSGLHDNDTAKKFWHVFRNGILHQATLSKKTQNGITMPRGGLSFDIKMIDIEGDNFWINAVNFSKKVIDVISNDFENYEAKDSKSRPLPTVKQHPTILGTSAD